MKKFSVIAAALALLGFGLGHQSDAATKAASCCGANSCCVSGADCCVPGAQQQKKDQKQTKAASCCDGGACCTSGSGCCQ